ETEHEHRHRNFSSLSRVHRCPDGSYRRECRRSRAAWTSPVATVAHWCLCSRFEPIEDDNIDAAGYKQPSVRGFTPRPAAHSKLCPNSTSRSKKDVAAVRTDALALVETRLVGCEEHIRWYDVVDLAEPTL